MTRYVFAVLILCICAEANLAAGTDPDSVKDKHPSENFPQVDVPTLDLPTEAKPSKPKSDKPRIAGVDGVSNPRLLEASKQQPKYPKKAVKRRVESSVVLQAVVRDNGKVGEVKVLSCKRPGWGFEEAAIKAVKKWRYKPAIFHGEPVAVFFTVYVDFKLP